MKANFAYIRNIHNIGKYTYIRDVVTSPTHYTKAAVGITLSHIHVYHGLCAAI